MVKSRKRRLLFILGFISVISISVGLILSALNDNLNLFYSPKDIAENQVPFNQTIKIGGMVMRNSIQRNEGLKVKFKISDMIKELEIEYSGILPDLFKEGQGVVAIGKLDSKDKFIASSILAKHDENYMPIELENHLDKAIT